jgi:alpha-1,6-mannosyltransferase
MPFLITATAALYAWLGLGFDAVNGWAAVGRFLLTMAALFALYALAIRRLHVGTRAPSVRGILGAAVLFRLLLLPAGLPPEGKLAALAADLTGAGAGFERFLLYDHDAWRYLWDGQLTRTGLHPYRSTPEQIEARAEAGEPVAVALLEDPAAAEVFELLPFQSYRTVYPPLAQGLFALSAALAPGSVLVWKLLVVALDLLACGLLLWALRALGHPPAWILLYAWNPLLIKEIAGSGHVEAAVLALLAAGALAVARGRTTIAASALGLAALTKVGPLVALPAFLRAAPRHRWPLAALPAMLVALPFVTGWLGLLEGLATFGREWRFNAGAWRLAFELGEALGPGLGKPLAHGLWLGATAAAALAFARRSRSPSAVLAEAYVLLSLFLLLSPAVMPWYALWALPFAVLLGAWAWLVACGLVTLSYLTYVDGLERQLPLALAHGAIWLVWAWELRQKLGGWLAPEPPRDERDDDPEEALTADRPGGEQPHRILDPAPLGPGAQPAADGER